MRFVTVVPSVFVGVSTGGTIGAAWGVLFSGAAVTIISPVMVQRQLNCRGIDFFRRLWRPILAIALMALIVFSLRGAWATSGDFVSIVIEAVVSIGAGAIIYIGSLFAFWRLAARPHGAESRFLNLCVEFRKKR